MHILFVNDNALELYAQKHLCTSQGYALLDSTSDAVVFDLDEAASSEAYSRTRQAIRSVHLHPERVNSRYWQYCDESAIASNGAGLRHCADLVWKHLSALQQKYLIGPLVIVAPSHYQAQQLELLMGVANAAGVEPIAVVNKTVLAISQVADSADQELAARTFAHVDIQLHQTVISYVAVTGSEVSLLSHDVVAGCSISKLQDAVLNHLQTRFIEQERFDPLHHASTEQQLFDQLDVGAQSISEQGFFKFSADYKQKVYSQNLDELGWTQACTDCFAALPEIDGHDVVVDANGAFHSTLILASADERFNEALLVNSPALLLATTKSTVESALKSQGLKEDGTQESIINLDAVQLLRDSKFEENETAKSIDESNEQVELNRAADDSTNSAATHVAINGIAMRIDRASVGFDGGVLQFTDNEPNIQQLLAQASLTTASGSTTQLTLMPGERLVSDLGDGVLTALRIIE